MFRLPKRMERMLELVRAHERAGFHFCTEANPPGAARVRVEDGDEVVNMGSNCYSGLNLHPKVIERTVEMVRALGVGVGSSPALVGITKLRRRLEEAVAALTGAEDAVLFCDGYGANVGCLSMLVNRQSVVYSDERNHASIIDGLQCAGATVVVYPHTDTQALQELMDSTPSVREGQALIVTDGVFSMDGDLAPLDALVRIAHQRQALLYVDDAHGAGVLGNKGLGTPEHLGVHGGPDVQLTTLSKFYGASGGVISGPKDLMDVLRHFCRSQVFSTAPAVPVMAAALAAIEISRSEEGAGIRQRLHGNRRYLVEGLNDLGYGHRLGSTATPIIPFLVEDAHTLGRLQSFLFHHNILVPAIPPASAATGSPRLRMCVNVNHEQADLDRVLHALDQARSFIEPNELAAVGA